MPRRPRLSLPGVPLHVIQRGNNRQACFFAEEDYRLYLHWLAKGAERYGCAIHAYVLMTNHVHLLLSPQGREGASRLIQSLGRRYVQYVSRSYKRSGTLWEGRYKASVVQAEEYLLRCCRYIEMNPARAGMVKDPAQYPWSSYRWHGLGEANPLISDHALYTALGRTPEERQAGYRALFHTELDDEAISDIRNAANQGLVLGDERFAKEIERALGVRAGLQKRGRRRRAGTGGTDGEQTGFEF